MALSRFTSLEEAEQALWELHPGPSYFMRIRGLFELADKLGKGRQDVGIKKFRSLEERNQALERKA